MQTGSGSGAAENPCDQFENIDYLVTAAVRALLALGSFICCAIVIFLILVYKQYHSFVQRLILYVCLASALNSLAIASQKVDYFVQNNATESYCVFAGFFSQYTSQVELLAVIGLVLGLYVNVFSKKLRKRVEVLSVISVLVIPALVSWLPFIDNSYGKTGPWCWIRERELDCNIHVLGQVLQYLLWYLPLLVAITVVLCVYFLAYHKLRQSIKGTWARPYDPEVQLTRGQLRKNVRLLLTYIPLLYLLFTLFALPNAIYWSFGSEPILALWVIQAVVLPLRGALFAIPYIFNKHTRKKISQTKLRVLDNQVSKRANSVNPYPAVASNFSDSLRFALKEDCTLERNKVYRNPSLSQSSVETVPHKSGSDTVLPSEQQVSGICRTTEDVSPERQHKMPSIVEESGNNA